MLAHILQLPSVTVGVLEFWERKVVKRLSFACAEDLVTHMTMQITRILNKSTTATEPTITGIMSCKFKPPDVYVSVPAVKVKFVPIITQWRKKPFMADAQPVKTLLVLTITVASDTPPGACEGGVQRIYKEQALDCHLQCGLTDIHVYTNLPLQNRH